MSIEDFISIQEAAKDVNVTIGTIHNWLRAEHLDRHRQFNRVLIDRVQFEALKKFQGQHPFDWRKLWPNEKNRLKKQNESSKNGKT